MAYSGPSGHQSEIVGTKEHFDVTASLYNPPLTSIWNNGTSGSLHFRGPYDTEGTSYEITLNQYEKLINIQVIEVVSFDIGMTLVGGR